MTMKRPSDFVARKRINSATAAKDLRALLFRAETRVAEAKLIGWPALAESWQRDVDAIRARMAELTISPSKRLCSRAPKAEEAVVA
jgi:agmatine/peptidylarginine deiminase